MYAHGIDVLDRADDDAVVVVVADHLHLVLFPAEHGFLEQHLVGGRSVQAARHRALEFLAVIGDAPAAAAEGKGRPDDGREADFRLHRERFFHAMRDARARGLEPDIGHRAAEQFTVLGHVDGPLRGADHLHVEFIEDALAHQIERRVERRLAAHGGQQRRRDAPFR